MALQVSGLVAQFNEYRSRIVGCFGRESKKLWEISPLLDNIKDLIVQSELDNSELRGRVSAEGDIRDRLANIEATLAGLQNYSEKAAAAAKPEKRQQTSAAVSGDELGNSGHPTQGATAAGGAPPERATYAQKLKGKGSKRAVSTGQKGPVLTKLPKPLAKSSGTKPLARTSKLAGKPDENPSLTKDPKISVRPEPLSSVIVRSTETGRTGLQVKAQLVASISPAKFGLTVRRVVATADSVVVKLPDQGQAATLIRAIEEAALPGITAREASGKTSSLIVFNVPGSVAQDTLKRALQVAAGVEHITDEELRLKTKLTGKAETVHWVFQTSSKVANLLLSAGKIWLGFYSCLVKRYTAVVRCFRCQRFGHYGKNCCHKQRCVNCGGDHAEDGCTEATWCVNCARLNKTEGEAWRTDHSAKDSQCKAFKLAIETVRSGQTWVNLTEDQDVRKPRTSFLAKLDAVDRSPGRESPSLALDIP